MLVRRTIEWGVSKSISDVFLGKLGVKEAYATDHERDVFGLQPSQDAQLLYEPRLLHMILYRQ